MSGLLRYVFPEWFSKSRTVSSNVVYLIRENSGEERYFYSYQDNWGPERSEAKQFKSFNAARVVAEHCGSAFVIPCDLSTTKENST